MSTAIDSVTQNLEKTSLAVTDPVEAQQATNTPPAPANSTRLYIGNLAYATTEDKLKEFFQGYGSVTVTIPVNPRSNRSVGYAFVDVEPTKEADRAIDELSGKEIDERKVSVQLARKPEDKKEKEKERGDQAPTSQRGARGRGRGGRGGRSGRGQAGDAEGAAPLTDVTNNANKTAPAADATATESAKPRAKHANEERAPRGPPADGIPSETKVMVANLPYDLTEEKLKQLFEAYHPTDAKIALRPIPRFMIKKLEVRGEARKGRGFGFVTLASKEDQDKAIHEMNSKNVEGREIAVKVAIDTPGKENETAAEAGGEAAANNAAAETKVDANGTNGTPATTA